MTSHRIHQILAASVFVYGVVLYGLTASPSASLWDAGEFIASAVGLQVMHPPGAPIYMLLGRLFSLFAPSGYEGFAVNMISVLSSAGTIALLYLIVVRLVREWQPAAGERAAWQDAAAMGGGLIGALAFSVTDSFWFNATEAEVYALSMLCTALATWLGLRWTDRAHEEYVRTGVAFGSDSSRYLILIGLVFGFAIGVHLMALLTFFVIAILVYFAFYDEEEHGFGRLAIGLGVTAVISAVLFAFIYPGVVITLPTLLGASGLPYGVFLALLVALVAGLLYVTHQQGLTSKAWRLANIGMLMLTAVLAGYSSYAIIPIRSAADPAIDLNDPESAEALVPYLAREQYGDTPLLRGRNYDQRTGRIDMDANELFPRRHSFQPNHERLYAQYDSDADYFWNYQLGHMYWRYFGWNYVGRASDEQGSPTILTASSAATDAYFYATPSERASRNAYWALPLLLGLFGIAVHALRDWRRFLAILALFVATGIGLVVYLNEIPITPRERDYIYVASYFAFALWIGIGATGLIGKLGEWMAGRGSAGGATIGTQAALGVVLFLAVPAHMLVQNYDDHDRSGNTFAPDFAHNLLNSLEPNAILFTEGDNDTYPLWYLQEVEGVRQDVRVVCLSLLNTPWYAKQLKNQQQHTSAPLPFSFTDAQLEAAQVRQWQPQEIGLPIPAGSFDAEDIGLAPGEAMPTTLSWRLEGRPWGQDMSILYYVDQMILDILATNAQNGWERPVYFASTTASASQMNLQPFFQREGLAQRLTPMRHDEPRGRVALGPMAKRLAEFQFGNLNNPDVYFAADARGMAGFHLRETFAMAIEAAIEAGDDAQARAWLDRIMAEMPPGIIELDVYNALPLARAHAALGMEAEGIALLREHVEPRALHSLGLATTMQQQQQAAYGVQQLQLAYLSSAAFDEAAALSDRLADLLGDEDYRMSAEDLRQVYERQFAPRAAPEAAPVPGGGE